MNNLSCDKWKNSNDRIERPENKTSFLIDQIKFWKDLEIFTMLLDRLHESFSCYLKQIKTKNNIIIDCDCLANEMIKEEVKEKISNFELKTLIFNLVEIFETLKEYHKVNKNAKPEVLDKVISEFNNVYNSIILLLKNLNYQSSFILSQELIKESPLVEFFWSPENWWKVEKVSSNVETLTWYTSMDFYNWKIIFEELIFEQDKAQIKKQVEQYLSQNKKTFNQEYRIVSKNWEIKNVFDKKIAIYDEKWTIKMLYWFIFDNDWKYMTNFWFPNIKSLERDLNNINENTPVNLFLIKIRNLDTINSTLWRDFWEKVIKGIWNFLENFNLSIYQISASEFAFLDFPKENSFIDVEKYVLNFFNNINNHEIENNWIKVNLPVSMWISLMDKKDMLKKAQLALDSSREKNHPIIYSDWLQNQTKKKNEDYMNWNLKIKEWIKNNKFIPYYQWIRNNNTKWPINKFESLVRYIEEDWNVLTPFFFLEHAKKSNLLPFISKIMIEEVIKKLSEDKDEHYSINLSIEDLQNETILKFLYAKIKYYQIEPSRLIIEVLEEASIWQDDQTFQEILKLKELWVKIAIDDFWVGSSNYQRLLKLKPDFIKIDWFFIEDLDKSPEKKMIVKNIVDLAKIMGSETIAEFVETEEIQKIVEELWIDYSQGYLFSKPHSKDEKN